LRLRRVAFLAAKFALETIDYWSFAVFAVFARNYRICKKILDVSL